MRFSRVRVNNEVEEKIRIIRQELDWPEETHEEPDFDDDELLPVDEYIRRNEECWGRGSG